MPRPYDKLLENKINELSNKIEAEAKQIQFNPNEVITEFTADIKKISKNPMRSIFFNRLDDAICSTIVFELISASELVDISKHDNKYVPGNKISYTTIHPLMNKIYTDNIKKIRETESSERFDINYAKGLMSKINLSEESVRTAVVSNKKYKKLHDSLTLDIITNISNTINFGILNIPCEDIFTKVCNEIEESYTIYALWLVRKATLFFDENIKNLNPCDLTQDSCRIIVNNTIKIMKFNYNTIQDKKSVDPSFILQCEQECSNLFSYKRMRGLSF